MRCFPAIGPWSRPGSSAIGCCSTLSPCCCSSCSCFLGLRLRARAIALRRRAAFEHVIAENSTRLINCSPAETGTRLKQVLGEFSRIVDADRAYVVLDEKPIRVHTWSKDGVTFPPGWPRQALAVAEQLGAATDSVTIADASALPPGPVKDALTDAGVRAWACVPLIRPGRVRGIMGFDRFRPIRNRISPVPIARLAGDAVANALEREFLERDRAKLSTRLERARRMQMVGSLASGIAHNFNNIIGAILGYSEMIEPQLARGTKPAQHIDEIRRAAERGRDLVDNILTFGRRTDARARPVQVRTLLEEAASLLRASLPSDVELVFEDVPADVAVSGEPAQLQQVILNLCTNAAQAMDDSGCIRVAAKQEQVAVFRRNERRRTLAWPLRLPFRQRQRTRNSMNASRDECSSRSSRLAWPEPALVWQRFAKSFAIMMEPSTYRANRDAEAASRSGCPRWRQASSRRTDCRRCRLATARPC